MKTISPVFIALFLFTTVCFGQTATDTTASKKLIVIKMKNFTKESDARVVDRIFIQCKDIYSSETDFKTSICKIIADKTITYETISKYLSDKGYAFEPVSIKPATAKDLEQEQRSNKKFIQHAN